MNSTTENRNFALIGVGGYVPPRHMHAIKEVGGVLKVAADPADSVGVIDHYFPDARFFVEFERFDRHVNKLRRARRRGNWNGADTANPPIPEGMSMAVQPRPSSQSLVQSQRLNSSSDYFYQTMPTPNFLVAEFTAC